MASRYAPAKCVHFVICSLLFSRQATGVNLDIIERYHPGMMAWIVKQMCFNPIVPLVGTRCFTRFHRSILPRCTNPPLPPVISSFSLKCLLYLVWELRMVRFMVPQPTKEIVSILLRRSQVFIRVVGGGGEALQYRGK